MHRDVFSLMLKKTELLFICVKLSIQRNLQVKKTVSVSRKHLFYNIVDESSSCQPQSEDARLWVKHLGVVSHFKPNWRWSCVVKESNTRLKFTKVNFKNRELVKEKHILSLNWHLHYISSSHISIHLNSLLIYFIDNWIINWWVLLML